MMCDERKQGRGLSTPNRTDYGGFLVKKGGDMRAVGPLAASATPTVRATRSSCASARGVI